MGIRQFKPVTKGTRFRSVSDFADITRRRPRSRCSSRSRRAAGATTTATSRCAAAAAVTSGSIASSTSSATSTACRPRCTTIEYDPNRSARIALVTYADGEKRYILHPKGLSVGDTIMSGPGSDIRSGNALPLAEMPLGTAVHNVELKIGKGGQLCRSAGMSAQVVAKEGEYVTLRMPSTRNAARARQLLRDDRHGRQRGARAASRGARPARRAGRDAVRRCAAKS